MTKHTDTTAIRLGTTLDGTQDLIAEILIEALFTDAYGAVFDAADIVSFTLVPRAPRGLIAHLTRSLRRFMGRPEHEVETRWVAATMLFDECTADADFVHYDLGCEPNGDGTWFQIEPDTVFAYDAQAGKLTISAENGATVRVDANALRKLIAQMHRILDADRARFAAMGL